MLKIVALWTKPDDVSGFEADYFGSLPGGGGIGGRRTPVVNEVKRAADVQQKGEAAGCPRPSSQIEPRAAACGRKAERDRGTLQMLSPGERREFRLELRVLNGAEEVSKAIRSQAGPDV